MNKTNYHKYYYLLYKLRNSPTLCIVDESVYKKDLFERFNSLNIELREIFIPFHQMKVFESYKIKNYQYSTFEGVVLPTYPLLKEDEISLIIETINRWVKK